MRIGHIIHVHKNPVKFVGVYNSFHRKKIPDNYVEMMKIEREKGRNEDNGWKLADDFPAGLAMYSEYEEDGLVSDYVVFCKKGVLHGFKIDEWYEEDDYFDDEEDDWDDWEEENEDD